MRRVRYLVATSLTASSQAQKARRTGSPTIRSLTSALYSNSSTHFSSAVEPSRQWLPRDTDPRAASKLRPLANLAPGRLSEGDRGCRKAGGRLGLHRGETRQRHLAVWRRMHCFAVWPAPGIVDTVEVAVVPILLGGGIPVVGNACRTYPAHPYRAQSLQNRGCSRSLEYEIQRS